MATIVLDPCTDTAGTDLTAHTPTTGGAPSRNAAASGSAMVISNANRARSNAGSSNVCWYVWGSATPASAEYVFEADIYFASVNGFMAVMCRTSAGGLDGYYAGYNSGGGNWRILKIVGGVPTVLASSSGMSYSSGNTASIKFECLNATKTLYVGGVSVCSTSDNTITATGKPGLLYDPLTATPSNTLGQHIDNINVYDASTGITGTGSLTANAGTLSGAGTRTIPDITGTGAPSGTKHTLAGAGTHVPPTLTGSGAVTGAKHTLAGTGTAAAPGATGSGAPSGTKHTLSGAGTAAVPSFSGSGALTQGDDTLSGAGTSTPPQFTGSGDLAGGDHTLAGSGQAFAPGNVGSGDLAGSDHTLAGAGTAGLPGATGSGDLAGTDYTLAGSGTAAVPVRVGSGDLAGTPATLSGAGTSGTPPVSGAGALAGSPGLLAGAGTRTVPPRSGSGALLTGKATLAGTGVSGGDLALVGNLDLVAGDPGFVLIVAGGGLAADTVARWDGQTRNLTYDAPGARALIAIPASDIAVAKVAVLAVGATRLSVRVRGRIATDDDAPPWLAGTIVDDAILVETGDRLLAEDGALLLMEGDTDA